MKALPTGLIALTIAGMFAHTLAANAHPHVFVEANVDIVRNDKGEVTDIRYVWRFDPFFSSGLVLDFDDNANGILDSEDLEVIRQETKLSLAEYNYYTEIRKGEEVVEFYEPDPYLVEYTDGQLVMIMSLALKEPVATGKNGFKIAVSDPTYYVAVEMPSADSVKLTGGGPACKTEIVVPDFDALYEKDGERLAELFAADPDAYVEPSDDYLTWIEFECEA